MFDVDFDRLKNEMDFDLHNCSILLTGGTGFFGLWLIELIDWLRRTHRIDINLHVVSRDPEAILFQRPIYHNRKWLSFISGDVRSFEPPSGKIDYVIHAAADTSVSASRQPLELFDVICSGASHVFKTAHFLGAHRVLLVSSGAVYGPYLFENILQELEQGIIDPVYVSKKYGSVELGGFEKISEIAKTAPDPLKLSSAYGEGKRVSEALGAYIAHTTDLQIVTARCFAFIGAGLPLDGHFAIGNFIRDAIKGRDISLNSTGRTERSYMYAADLAIWLFTLLLKGRAGEAYNVGSDQKIDILSTARLVRDQLSPEQQITFANKASNDASFYVPDIKKAHIELGLNSWTPLDLAVRRTADDAKHFWSEHLV